MAEIHVCHAGTCRARGAEAVLAEIEELVSEVGGRCKVRQSGCLGYCSEAPNAIILERGARRLDPNTRVFTRIRTLDASAKVVERATGMRPPLEGAGTSERLASLRATRARQHAISVSKWNTALHGLAEQTAVKPALRSELSTLLRKAGFPEGVCANRSGQAMPSAIANYSQWSLESVTPVSRHSALFAFTSSDLKRGTPHPRGRGRMAEPVTWHTDLEEEYVFFLFQRLGRHIPEPYSTLHTTLLAEVGSNAEGPLPWVERDYTPVSSAKEWEQGRCEMLIKVYADGAATAWLHSASPQRVWLSLPQRTLRVPGLVSEGRAFRPSSVLLLLAGTGAVALPQILAHRAPTAQLGISSPRRDQLHVPVDVVLSCREDDALLLPQLAGWCRESEEGGAGNERVAVNAVVRGVRSCTLLLTPAAAGGAAAAPFPTAPAGDAAEAEGLLQGLPNARVVRARLSAPLVAEAWAQMAQPCRVVVSGPGGFNTAARAMLAEAGVDVEAHVTILSA